MAGSGDGDGAADAPSERVLRTRSRAAAPAKVDDQDPEEEAPASRKRARRTASGRGKPAAASDDDADAADGDQPPDGHATAANAGQDDSQDTKRPPRGGAKRKAASDPAASEADKDDDAEEAALLASVSRDARKVPTKRKRGTILAEFSSLDALLNNDQEEKKRKAQHADKLKRLREEAKGVGKRGSRMSLDASPMAKMMSDISQNISSLSADNHLFADELQPPRTHEEKYGFVFTPITEPIAYQPFKATPAELKSELKLVYKAMQATKEDELGALLWSKAILLRALLGSEQAKKKKPLSGSMSPVQPVVLPERICSWLFLTMSTHSNSHIVKGCLSNLFALVAGSTSHQTSTELKSGLPCTSFCLSVQDMRTAVGGMLPDLQMGWRPTIYDFVGAFRRFGFLDSKRSMSARSKIATTKKSSTQQQRNNGNNKPAVPFPTLNMQYVLAFLVLSLRTKLLRPDGYDAMSFTMFFLRMQFEHNMHPEIVQLATICIEELLDVFPTVEWRKEWGQSLVMRIAGANEGLFDSASGWLTVARRLPRTKRGTQLTTGLAVYVLQHRIDKAPEDVSKSERPLKFPIQSGLVLDIVAGIVEDLTAKYTEKKKKESNSDKAGSARLPPPPFDLLCKKVALMDLALQAFLNELTHREMSVLLGKLDDLTSSHKSTMSAKWHELKTLVGLMRRKYSLENLRVGRGDAPSPRAKAVLFLDDEDQHLTDTKNS